ncbi:MAG: HPr kinase/phosphorylase [Rhizobiaceae bacterium]|nr:HPr kinase/phosphorylase [Rhizobiaceae bacterium]MCV0404700.1 HPr kinase/phosphorylase [Rhizobiaceae bacterium]
MAVNIHAGCVLLGDRGVLIRGDAGSGKSTLALALLAAVRGFGGFASLVCDDRAELETRGGRLLARCPAAIAGLVEIRGLGVVTRPFRPVAVVDLAVTLVPGAAVERFPETATETVEGVRLRSLVLARRSADVATRTVLAAVESCGERPVSAGLPGFSTKIA